MRPLRFTGKLRARRAQQAPQVPQVPAPAQAEAQAQAAVHAMATALSEASAVLMLSAKLITEQAAQLDAIRGPLPAAGAPATAETAAVLAERERAAQVCETHANAFRRDGKMPSAVAATVCAAAIRAEPEGGA